jgi:hypothetical protein
VTPHFEKHLVHEILCLSVVSHDSQDEAVETYLMAAKQDTHGKLIAVDNAMNKAIV